MPNINEINTAIYGMLKNDTVLDGDCKIYKGEKRPLKAPNPSLTITAERLEPGEGEGIWMCDIVVTVYADEFVNKTADFETLERISSRIKTVLSDKTPELDNAKALPLIEGESSSGWNSSHEKEMMQRNVFGLVFVKFN